LRGHFEAGKEKGKGEERKERKGRDGRKHPQPPPPEIIFVTALNRVIKFLTFK